MPEKIKVLFIASHFQKLGGAEKNIISLMRGLDPERFAPSLAVLQPGPLADDLRSSGAPVWDLGLKKIFSARGLRLGLALAHRLREEKFHAVVTYHHDADLWGGFFAWWAGVPRRISSRRDMGFQLRPKHVWAYRLANRLFTNILAVSEAVKEAVARREWAPRDRISVVYNGVDEADAAAGVDTRAKRLELGLDPRRPVVGMAASFRPVKGQEHFVRAAALVLKKRPGVQFVIAGYKDGDYYPRVERLMQDLGVAPAVRCLGERADVPEILRALDVFVISSLNEGFCNAVVEAMAAGVPVAAAAGGGNPEAVLHGRTGLLFPPGDSAALAEALLRLLSDDDLRGRLAGEARDTARHRFSRRSMIEGTARLLDPSFGQAGAARRIPSETVSRMSLEGGAPATGGLPPPAVFAPTPERPT
jgi:L-malate glycosyltransferase